MLLSRFNIQNQKHSADHLLLNMTICLKIMSNDGPDDVQLSWYLISDILFTGPQGVLGKKHVVILWFVVMTEQQFEHQGVFSSCGCVSTLWFDYCPESRATVCPISSATTPFILKRQVFPCTLLMRVCCENLAEKEKLGLKIAAVVLRGRMNVVHHCCTEYRSTTSLIVVMSLFFTICLLLELHVCVRHNDIWNQVLSCCYTYIYVFIVLHQIIVWSIL